MVPLRMVMRLQWLDCGSQVYGGRDGLRGLNIRQLFLKYAMTSLEDFSKK